MKKYLFWLLLVIGLTLSAGQGFCEPLPDDEEKPASPREMEKIREKIETLKMWKLTKALDLNETTSARLFPLLNKYDQKRHELEVALREGMKELRESLKAGRSDKLKGLIDKLEQNHNSIQKIGDEERAEIKKILTLEQQANYIIFQQEFQREIREIIMDAKGKGPGKFGKNKSDKMDKPFPPERP